MSDRQIRILPSFTGYREGVICFETQCGPDEVHDLSKYAFEHHGDAFTPFHAGALRLFHERVLLGQDMPSVLVLTRWHRYDALMAAAIFIQPNIVLEPSCTSLVNSLDLVDRIGPPAFGHIPHDHKELAYMLRNLTESYVGSQAPVEKILETVSQCASLIVKYVQEGTLPPIDVPAPEYDILDDHGPFVAFEAADYAWDEMYGKGYLCGIWFHKDRIVVSRKSALVPYLKPERVLERLTKEDPEGDWEITHGAVLGSDTEFSREGLISLVKGML